MSASSELGTLAVLLGSLTFATWYVRRRRNIKESVPQDWLEIGHVESLLTFPLKSGAAISCTEFECTEQGPLVGNNRDRVLAVVRDDGSLVTGRDFPALIHVIAEIRNDILTLTCGPSKEQLDINLKQLEDGARTRQSLTIWKTTTDGVDCGPAAAQYLSAYLSSSVRLLYFPERNKGKSLSGVKTFAGLSFINSSDGGIFSDAMSFHLVNEASVVDLNSRLDNPVSARNFRPNIIISGDKLLPYEEDNWEWVKIGDVVFRVLAPCTRCLFTTVNPDTGEKSEKFEPLKTLRKYRVLRDPAKKERFGCAPVMGQYLGMRTPGVIHAGDAVSVPITKNG